MDKTLTSDDQIEALKLKIIHEPENTEYLKTLAHLYHDQSKYSDSIVCLRKLLWLQPANVAAIQNIGINLFCQQKFEEAKREFARLLQQVPQYIKGYVWFAKCCWELEAYQNGIDMLVDALEHAATPQSKMQVWHWLAQLQRKAKCYQEAITSLQSILELNPNDYSEMMNLIEAALSIKDFMLARKWITQLATDPTYRPFSDLYLARIALHNREAEQALTYLLPHLKQYPKSSLIHEALAQAYAMTKNEAKTLWHVEQALAFTDNKPRALRHLAELHVVMQNYDAAIAVVNQIFELDPHSTRGYKLLAQICLERGNMEELLHCIDILLQLDKTDPDIYMMQSYIYASAAYEDREKMCDSLMKAIDLCPNEPSVLMNLSDLFRHHQEPFAMRIVGIVAEKVVERYQKCEQQNTTFLFTHSESKVVVCYAHYCMVNARWQAFKACEPLLKKIIDYQINNKIDSLAMAPFTAHFALDTEQYFAKISKAMAQTHAVPTSMQFPSRKVNPNKKIKVGYVSPDFNGHVVGFLISDLFSFHDRDKYEIYAFPIRMRQDALQEKIAACCDHFIDLSHLGYFEAAKLIHDHEIDILIDLASYTGFSRTKIFAYQPAPIQAFFLGQAGTMGADYIQYHINTEALVPPSQLHLYTEQLVYLPETPIAVEQYPVPASCPTRAEYGLPEGTFIYCCFNNSYRINQETFQIWMQILAAVPNSVLWLQSRSEDYSKTIRAHAKRCGIASDRLIFRDQQILNGDWHHRLADVYLDTTVISGGTTTILSAWIDLPVITLAGPTPQGAFGAGVMQAACMPECVTHSLAEYQQLAIELGTNPAKLAALKRTMRERVPQSALFNQARFARHLELGYQLMIQDHNADHVDRIIRVQSL